MPVGIQFSDAAGVLGTGSADRLGRIMYQGSIAVGASITLPWLNYDFSSFSTCNGAIYIGSELFNPGSGLLSWNNTTKVMSNGGGISRTVLVIGFRGSTIPTGAVGIVIKNSAGEIIIDNANPNMEVIASGSTSYTSANIVTLPTEAGLADSFTFLRWTAGHSLCRGGGRKLVLDNSGTLDYIIARINPVYSPISDGLPGLCCIRQPDGLILFDSKRAYARIRTLIQLESFANTVDGGLTGSSTFTHNSIPTTAYFLVSTGYRVGTRCLFISRPDTSTWSSAAAETSGALSGDQRTELGLTSLGGYPGPALGVTVVANS